MYTQGRKLETSFGKNQKKLTNFLKAGIPAHDNEVKQTSNQ